jgi:hypothetical protein
MHTVVGPHAGDQKGASIALVAANPGRADTGSHWPHYGLVLLATILRRHGYNATVFDQSFLREPDDVFVERVARSSPDLIGVSLFTTHVTIALNLTRKLLARVPRCPAIAGGPHASLYADDMRGDPMFSALVKGEADNAMVDVVSRVLDGGKPGVVEAVPVDGRDIPAADFSVAPGYERMRWMPIQLSRGCPFDCSFCNLHLISGRKIRYRDISVCLDEIRRNLGVLRNVFAIRIVDDCPTLDGARFKRFLKLYIEQGFPARIGVDNMRADAVDEEILDLLKGCDVPYICFGVESGNPDVFGMIRKGETMEDVKRAVALVRRKRIPLYMCFVIGLPGSSFQAEMDSLRLAKSSRPHLIYWNMFVPYKGTRARDWFAEHGTVFQEFDHFSVPSYDLTFSEPAAESPDFPREERLRAYLKCVLETVSFVFTPRALWRACVLAARHGLWSSIPLVLLGVPRKAILYGELWYGRFLAGRRHRRKASSWHVLSP